MPTNERFQIIANYIQQPANITDETQRERGGGGDSRHPQTNIVYVSQSELRYLIIKKNTKTTGKSIVCTAQ